MLASKRNGTLYIGVTNNLERRIMEHKEEQLKGFTEKYHLHALVYYEESSDVNVALNREKQLKKWNRRWKISLIEEKNPNWEDLSVNWIYGSPRTRG